MVVDIKQIGLNAVKFHLLLEPYSYFEKKHSLAKEIKKWVFSRKQWDCLIKIDGFFLSLHNLLVYDLLPAVILFDQ